MQIFPTTPQNTGYDVVIIGGAMMGASAAWFLSDNSDFNGRVLVIEKDPSYSSCSTAHTNSCMRQQFSSALNVKISQFAANFVKNLRGFMGDDPRVPQLHIQNYGYLYLADTDAFADVLRDSHKVQVAEGAGTQLLTPDQIKSAFPFYALDDVVLGSLNTVDEGYWDCVAVFDWWRKSARERGVEYIANEVVAIAKNAAGSRVVSVTLKSGEVIACDKVLNASGPRANRTAQMAGISLPVEPRKRFTYIFSAAMPLDRELPLTIDPSGVHFRQDGKFSYLAGGHCGVDPAVEFDDFTMDPDLWQDHIWPVIAGRIPQFDAIKVTSEWAGHYAYNTFDHNAITGTHTEVENFYFLNGFSGHGLQQAPAMGRGMAELMTYGEYRSLDLSAFDYARIPLNRPFIEKAII